MKTYYLLLLVASYLFPFLYTIIHKRVLKKLNYRFINSSTLLAGIPFLLWDYLAVARDHWSFNNRYITEIRIAGLPIEEYFFYLLIPQATLLIWVALNKYNHWSEVKKDLALHKDRIKI